MIKKAALVMMIIVFCFALTGCNTMKGLGKDLKRAGEKIEKKASD
jgi:predicted small secreted protein